MSIDCLKGVEFVDTAGTFCNKRRLLLQSELSIEDVLVEFNDRLLPHDAGGDR